MYQTHHCADTFASTEELYDFLKVFERDTNENKSLITMKWAEVVGRG